MGNKSLPAWHHSVRLLSVSHPACNGGVSLRLGDEVAEQGVGAEEVQADIGSLCKVSQRRWVGKVFGPRTAIDKGYHNLNNTNLQSIYNAYYNIKLFGLLQKKKRRKKYIFILPLHSPKGWSASILWCRAGRHHLINGHWAAFQTSQYTHVLNLPKEEEGEEDTLYSLYFYNKSFIELISSFVNVKKLHDTKGKDQRSIILNGKTGILNNLKSISIYTLEEII